MWSCRLGALGELMTTSFTHTTTPITRTTILLPVPLSAIYVFYSEW